MTYLTLSDIYWPTRPLLVLILLLMSSQVGQVPKGMVQRICKNGKIWCTSYCVFSVKLKLQSATSRR